MGNRRKLLVIDGGEWTKELFTEPLSQQFQVIRAFDGESGLKLADSERPDLILLDLLFLKMCGLEVCRALRTSKATRNIPILVMTGKCDAETRMAAFRAGADDFIAKPVSAGELIARVESKIRRIEERAGTGDVLDCGNLSMDLHKLEATVGGKKIALSVLEFSLLKFFVQNPDHVLSRERILKRVWRDHSISERTVDSHIVSLRKKLARFDYILVTVYGEGYVLKKQT